MRNINLVQSYQKISSLDGIDNTLFVGKVLHHLPQINSTNLYAQTLLSKSNPSEGTAISTYHQTAGRGQIGNKWVSAPDKNIALSVIFFPSFLSVADQFQLNIACSLAIYDALQHTPMNDLKVKWPNDIMVGARKIAGLLIQNTLRANRIKSTIAGIGINVNQQKFGPDAGLPTSIILQTGKTTNLDALRNLLCSTLEQRYLQLKNGHADHQRDVYCQYLYRAGQWHHFKNNNTGKIFKGKIIGINSKGQLRVATINGTTAFNFKAISFL